MISKGASPRTPLWSRTCQSLVASFIVISLSTIAAELVARYVFNLSPLEYARQVSPVLTTGDQVPPARLSALYDAPGGPGSLGYRPGGLTFDVDPAAPPPASMTTISDFVFEHELSRYSADDVDRLFARHGLPNHVTMAGKRRSHDAPNLRFIIHHKNRRCVHRISPALRSTGNINVNTEPCPS